jgi:hypothetical protein
MPDPRKLLGDLDANLSRVILGHPTALRRLLAAFDAPIQGRFSVLTYSLRPSGPFESYSSVIITILRGSLAANTRNVD